ncbi:MAG: hypothetical protein GF334_03610, partial [Candidatus Altiarchaeales archaeon]|nr:hypothetical protein [Candidatus Altiarchaeales archaeon]
MTFEEKLIDLVKRRDWVGLLREIRREGFLPRSVGFLPGDLVNVWTATMGKQPGEMIYSSENGVAIKPAGSKFTGEEAFFPYSSV